ncbi:MAG: hypothetical protein WD035_05375, partial [Balneolaceae bacterium]
KMSVVLPNPGIFVNLKSSLIANKLRFQIHSGFDLEQNPCSFFERVAIFQSLLKMSECLKMITTQVVIIIKSIHLR